MERNYLFITELCLYNHGVTNSWTWLSNFHFEYYTIIPFWFSFLQLRISQFSSVQSLSHVRLFVNPWIAARQASLSITNSQSLLKLVPIKSVMPSSHLILCLPLLLLPLIPPSIRVFSNESSLHMRLPKYWSLASASVLTMNTRDWSPLGRTGWLSL